MADLITLTDPRSAAAEAYQSLRTNIEFSNLDQPLQTLLLTSADTSTDKSSALANLAVVMAQAGDSVLVVDGDLRRPQQHTIFGVDGENGLSNWLQSGDDVPIQDTEIKGVRVVSSGPLPPNPAALLSARRLTGALIELQKHADYVLCDAPPVLAVTDAALWASKVDGVVLLVNAGRTKRDHAQRAKDVLEKVHAKIVGAVLLNAEPDKAVIGY
ncbi:MAG: CpsD/CapB family tyrosine-protein kinase [Chloroflexota bacterium]